ncbi:uncharacterized protein BBA_09097 [Beauveria bassiana ARSEF 2860]|uniref:Uncharacterized protein n=1 Tax=Beauveria bassiana (strain ARSEF 2860) TaxID=655819 RepID=J5JDV4_BEAB2|nr:uncharacterized protein BBA_09097 [Beauveria bassiana ARSEF 2860]EJP61941.1 hypothetical protein BBA_09097 [Beauveria bassiana ARSEF 2860]
MPDPRRDARSTCLYFGLVRTRAAGPSRVPPSHGQPSSQQTGAGPSRSPAAASSRQPDSRRETGPRDSERVEEVEFRQFRSQHHRTSNGETESRSEFKMAYIRTRDVNTSAQDRNGSRPENAVPTRTTAPQQSTNTAAPRPRTTTPSHVPTRTAPPPPVSRDARALPAPPTSRPRTTAPRMLPRGILRRR